MSRCFRIMAILISMLWALAPAAAQDGDKVAITAVTGQERVFTYAVVVTVKGSMPVSGSADAVDLDVVYDLTVRHQYGRSDKDGLTPLEISVIDSKAKVGGQELAVAAGTFPRISILLDRDGKMTDVFGLANYPRTVPGINYGNLIILFILHDANVPRAIGEQWVSDVKFPAYGETYRFTSVIKSVNNEDGVEAAAVAQSIEWLDSKPAGDVPATAKATADSVFAVDGGRLLRSSAKCEVVFGTAASHKANITISVSPMPAANRP